MLAEPQIFEYIDGDNTQWEKEPLEGLARDGQLMAYRHDSFWQCMDTLRERKYLEGLWAAGNAPWRLWREDDPARFYHYSAGTNGHDGVLTADQMTCRGPNGQAFGKQPIEGA